MPPRSSFAIDVPSALLAHARKGRAEAFEQLYRRFERPVFSLALRLCGDRDQAQDVLQETMLKLFRQIGSYRADDGCPFWGWLRRIAVNETLMRLRRDKAHLLESTEESDEWQQHGEDLAPLPPAAADAALLQRALRELPPITRSVLWLYHGEGYTHEEIAALMQRTPSFSKSQLARGIRRLRALLQIEESTHA